MYNKVLLVNSIVCLKWRPFWERTRGRGGHVIILLFLIAFLIALLVKAKFKYMCGVCRICNLTLSSLCLLLLFPSLWCLSFFSLLFLFFLLVFFDLRKSENLNVKWSEFDTSRPVPRGETIPDILPVIGIVVYFPALLVTKCETPVRIAPVQGVKLVEELRKKTAKDKKGKDF